MTVKQKLERLRKLRGEGDTPGEIDSWRCRVMQIVSGVEGGVAQYREGSRGTAEQDKMGAAISSKAFAEGKLALCEAEYAELIAWAEQAFAVLSDRERMAMEMYYLTCATWQEVADAMHYTLGSCDNLQRAAVATIEHGEWLAKQGVAQ
jgi:DNA-directed RNA polymerase specialized sigma24 family protein